MSDIVIIHPGKDASLSVTSSAFAHGFGLFETIRFAKGRLYFWKRHWSRLAASAKVFGLGLPAEDRVLAALRDLVASAEIQAGVLKLSLMRDGSVSRLFVYSRPMLVAPAGGHLLFDPTWPIAADSLLAGHKTHNYMESICLLNRARSDGYFDVLRVDGSGNLAETASSNVFFVRGSQLLTPSLETGILPGVVRGALLEADALDTEVGVYAPGDLESIESIFLTNATHGFSIMERITKFGVAEARRLETSSVVLEAVQSVLVRVEGEQALQLI